MSTSWEIETENIELVPLRAAANDDSRYLPILGPATLAPHGPSVVSEHASWTNSPYHRTLQHVDGIIPQIQPLASNFNRRQNYGYNNPLPNTPALDFTPELLNFSTINDFNPSYSLQPTSYNPVAMGDTGAGFEETNSFPLAGYHDLGMDFNNDQNNTGFAWPVSMQPGPPASLQLPYQAPLAPSPTGPMMLQPNPPASRPLPRQTPRASLSARKPINTPDQGHLRCPKGCRQTFRRAGDYRRHMKKHEAPEFKCVDFDCDKAFYRLDKLRDHVKVHGIKL
ncbi:hypothetical protein K505DRAFT_331204 [Melanomma pulvis-pyrius CBS 109.77]|uniref:C2H2-type domain-containing protein n=1 Tax=Melanomma pulvis-pyrius CBS 109.77 TaxID=1314802 RepID=A0A6A6XXE3_9PLEO|nr:hypothetical protein K505DRAFT_331204 [Melanomma pulvis-pyrius CBS 109.77]